MDEHDILVEFKKKKSMTIEDLRPLAALGKMNKFSLLDNVPRLSYNI